MINFETPDTLHELLHEALISVSDNRQETDVFGNWRTGIANHGHLAYEIKMMEDAGSYWRVSLPGIWLLRHLSRTEVASCPDMSDRVVRCCKALHHLASHRADAPYAGEEFYGYIPSEFREFDFWDLKFWDYKDNLQPASVAGALLQLWDVYDDLKHLGR